MKIVENLQNWCHKGSGSNEFQVSAIAKNRSFQLHIKNTVYITEFLANAC